MNHDAYPDELIRSILANSRSVAIVGASANNNRPSWFVLKFLLTRGFKVFPVNPGLAGKEISGARVYARLDEIGEAIDIVDIFRNSQAAEGIVEEALALTPLPKVIWMQLGVRNEDAARRARAAGVTVIMNRCPKIEYGRLSGEIGWTGVNTRLLSSKRQVMGAGFQRLTLERK